MLFAVAQSPRARASSAAESVASRDSASPLFLINPAAENTFTSCLMLSAVTTMVKETVPVPTLPAASVADADSVWLPGENEYAGASTLAQVLETSPEGAVPLALSGSTAVHAMLTC